MTDEEIAKYAAVKATGVCCEAPLQWVKTSVGVVSYVDGVKVNSVRECLVGSCLACLMSYEKSLPAPVNLDSL